MTDPSSLLLLYFSVCETFFRIPPSLKPKNVLFLGSPRAAWSSQQVTQTFYQARLSLQQKRVLTSVVMRFLSSLKGWLFWLDIVCFFAVLCLGSALLGSQLPTYIFTTNKMQVHIRMTLTTKRCIQFVCQNTVVYFYLIVWTELFFQISQIARGS